MKEKITGSEREWWEVECHGRKYITNHQQEVSEFMSAANRGGLSAEVWHCKERKEIVRTITDFPFVIDSSNDGLGQEVEK